MGLEVPDPGYLPKYENLGIKGKEFRHLKIKYRYINQKKINLTFTIKPKITSKIFQTMSSQLSISYLL